MTKSLGLLIAILSCSILSHAKAPQVLRDIRGLVDPKPELAVRVQTARILLADYALIRADFPSTRTMSEPEIDHWLLNRTAYISQEQAKQTNVNSEIQIQKDSKGVAISVEAYRPQLYGRALVFKADDGIIDVKGSGAERAPKLEGHKTGLASLGEAIREFLFQKKVQQIFDHSGSGLHTIGTYAIIDWGFDTRDIDGTFLRAGAVLRQGHARPRIVGEGNHFANIVETRIIEDLLRHYGLTSTGDAPTATREGANVQISKDGAVVDFGAFLAKAQFSKTVVHYGTEEILSQPNARSFVQPDHRLKLPANVWGSTGTGIENPRYDNGWVWSHELAAALKAGHARREHATTHFYHFMNAGVPPADMAGTFKHTTTDAYRAKIAQELIHQGAAANGETLRIFLAGAASLETKAIEKVLLSASFKLVHPENVFPMLKKHGVLERHPALWDTVVQLAQPGSDGTILVDLMQAKRSDLIEKVLAKDKNVSERLLNLFLSSDFAKESPLWPKWVSIATRTYWGFGATFLAKEPLTAKHPELFNELFRQSDKPRPHQLMEVLNSPHWQRNTAALQKTRDYFKTFKMEETLKATFLQKVEVLLKAAPNSSIESIKVMTCEGLLAR